MINNQNGMVAHLSTILKQANELAIIEEKNNQNDGE